MRQVDLVAPTDTTVLIQGETGTGKGLIARALHERSPRRDHALVKLNCSAISAGLVESELFGHLKGAFTGASDRRVGRFELADGGTLFLDEVSELPLDTQTKLLRVLQEGEFDPSVARRQLRSTFALSPRATAISPMMLRRDDSAPTQFYRLKVFPIEIPPLRARGDDIAILAEHFRERFARKLGKKLTGIDVSTLAMLKAHSWPGNIRDLQNTIERAAIPSSGPLQSVDWPLELAPQSCFSAAAPKELTAVAQMATGGNGIMMLEECERRHFITILRKTRGVIEGPTGAAKLLDLKTSTARFRIKKLRISREDYL